MAVAQARAALALFILLAGCIGPAQPAGTATETQGPGPGPEGPEVASRWPECTLAPMEFLVPEAVPGAPRPRQPLDGLEALHAEVKVDAAGASHVYANDAYSLFYANGYVQAKDRLFQMELVRQIARGTSASLMGAGQLASDHRVARDLYTAEEVDAQYEQAPEHAKQVLVAFVDGINRFIAEATAGQQPMPGEFSLLNSAPTPWRPQDVVAILDYYLATFGQSGGHEVLNAQRLVQLQDTLPAANATMAFDDLGWARAEASYPTIPAGDLVANGCEDITHAAADSEQALLARLAPLAVEASVPDDSETCLYLPCGQPREGGPLGDDPEGGGQAQHGPATIPPPTSGAGLMEGFHFGSLAVLVDGAHTATGRPMMVGGPQLGYHKPSLAHQIGLHGDGWDVAGIGLVGTPGVLVGRNAHFAWTITSGGEDQVDIVAVRTRTVGEGEAATQYYMWDGVEEEMQCRSVAHRTHPFLAQAIGEGQGQPGLPQAVRQVVCRLGTDPPMPVIARAADPDDPAKGVAWAFRTTTRNKEVDAMWMWFNVGRQTSLEGARAMLDHFPFSFNFHFADEDGIAFLHTGAVPLRAAGLDTRLPTPGGNATAWTGVTYTSGLGLWADTSSTGYFVNWNNAPALGWRTGDVPQRWGTVSRADVLDAAVRARIEATGGRLTFNDMLAIERSAATRDTWADHFAPALLEAARSHSGMGQMADQLQAWIDAGVPWTAEDVDGTLVYAHPAHGIYDRAIGEFLRRITGDELGEIAPVLRLDPREGTDAHAGDHGHAEAMYPLLADAIAGRTRHDWCDNNGTRPRESCKEGLISALRLALSTLTEEKGTDATQWLVDIHRSEFVPMGGLRRESIPMVNRGTWVQVVAIGEGLRGAAATLPPSNTGAIDANEVLSAALVPDSPASAEPPRLSQELQRYIAFEFRPFPLTEAEVEAVHVPSQRYMLVVVPSPTDPAGLPDVGSVWNPTGR